MYHTWYVIIWTCFKQGLWVGSIWTAATASSRKHAQTTVAHHQTGFSCSLNSLSVREKLPNVTPFPPVTLSLSLCLKLKHHLDPSVVFLLELDGVRVRRGAKVRAMQRQIKQILQTERWERVCIYVYAPVCMFPNGNHIFNGLLPVFIIRHLKGKLGKCNLTDRECHVNKG